MDFLWDDNNLKHLASHGVTPEMAEAVFLAGADDLRPSRTAHRYIVEGTLDGRDYRLVCDIAHDGTVYAVTAYPL